MRGWILAAGSETGGLEDLSRARPAVPRREVNEEHAVNRIAQALPGLKREKK